MPTVLDLSRFRQPVGQFERRFDPAVFEASEDFRVVAPVVFRTEVRRDGRKFQLVGQLATTLEVLCSRCLEPFSFPVDVSFDLMFLPEATVSADDEKEVGAEDVGVSFYKDDEIDLADVMREQFYLALPMKPLCRDDCQGLCPVCGTNRNTGTCTCKSDWVDPRMEALRKLRPTE